MGNRKLDKIFNEVVQEDEVRYLCDNGYFKGLYLYDAMWEWYIRYFDMSEKILDFDSADDEIKDMLVEYERILGNLNEEIMFNKMCALTRYKNGIGKFQQNLGWKYKKIGAAQYRLQNNKFLALQLLFLVNDEFAKLFTKKDEKKERTKTNIVLDYAENLEYYMYEANYSFLYEKVTGINYAILLSNYLSLIFEEFDCSLKYMSYVITATDDEEKVGEFLQRDIPQNDLEFNKIYLEECKNTIKYNFIRLAEVIADSAMVFDRIVWLNNICFNMYKEILDYKRSMNSEISWTLNDLKHIDHQLVDSLKEKISNIKFNNKYNNEFNDKPDDYEFKNVFEYIYEKFDNLARNEYELFWEIENEGECWEIFKKIIQAEISEETYQFLKREFLKNSDEKKIICFKILNKQLLSEIFPDILESINRKIKT